MSGATPWAQRWWTNWKAADHPLKRVLFVCGHNAGRSLAAEAICHKLRPEITVASAGTTPQGPPNPAMVTALAEAGYVVVGMASKGVEAVGGLAGWDLVVTMGCMDAGCPAIPPGVRHEDWRLADPATEPETIPATVQEIAVRVRAL